MSDDIRLDLLRDAITASGTQCDNCYSGATGLDDYDDIPAEWK